MAGAPLSDLNLASLMASKICHDLIGPVGAIGNGLELLEEETDETTRAYAYEVIEYSAKVAWARLEFARLAFGASTSLGAQLDLDHAATITRTFIEEGKHTLSCEGWHGLIDKERGRLALIVTAISPTAIPAGGTLTARLQPAGGPFFALRASGRNARVPERAAELFAGGALGEVEPREVLPYLAGRLAVACGLRLSVEHAGDDIVFRAG